MVVGIARGRQPPAFDRIGENYRGAICGGVGLFKDTNHLGEVVAAQIADDAGQFLIAYRGQQPFQVCVLVPVYCDEAAPQLVAGQTHQQLILLVAHVIDAFAHALAVLLGKEALQLASILRLQHLPTPTVEHRHQRPGADAGNHPVQALAVQIHDPDVVGQFGHPVGEDGFPYIALVQLCVADDGNKAVGGHVFKVQLGIVVGQRGKGRGDCSQPYGAGGEIDRVGILGTAGIGLQAAKGAQGGQVVAGQLAEQVLDGVKDRRGVGLDRHPVAVLEQVKVERGHNGHHAGRRGLVSTNFDAVPLRTNAVGLMHDAHGEPQYPFLNVVECLQILG